MNLRRRCWRTYRSSGRCLLVLLVLVFLSYSQAIPNTGKLINESIGLIRLRFRQCLEECLSLAFTLVSDLVCVCVSVCVRACVRACARDGVRTCVRV